MVKCLRFSQVPDKSLEVCMMRKKICVFLSSLLALILLCGVACSAVSDGVLKSLLTSADSLLFHTHNVTVTGHADFSLDGERFKTADILYKQDGENSHWQMDLLTPRPYRSDRETGYTVIANGEKIYVIERYHPGVYKTGSASPCSTLVRPSTASSALVTLGLSLADAVEISLPSGALTVLSNTAECRELQISLNESTTPPMLNNALNLAAAFAIRRFMGIDYDQIKEEYQGHFEDYLTVTQGILYSTDSFVLGDTSLRVSLDDRGRLTAVSGSVTAFISPKEAQEKELKVDFSLTVSDYGATRVETFDPHAFNVVLSDGTDGNYREVDPALAEKLITHAAEIARKLGYDPDTDAPEMWEDDGFFHLFFPGMSLTMNRNGDLVYLDAGENYYLADAHEPDVSELSPEDASKLAAMLKEAFPDLASGFSAFVPVMQYDYDGQTYLSLEVLGETGADTGIFLVIRADSSVRIVSFNLADAWNAQ